MLADQWVEIYTDGACSGNPGPGGWGAILRWNAVEKELWGGEAATTNNRMEITAVIRALESLKHPVAIKVYTDSQYVKNGITVWMHNWKKNGWINSQKKPVANAELWRRLDELCAQHQMQWYWVRGHDGHPENTRADELARRGVGEVRKSGNQ